MIQLTHDGSTDYRHGLTSWAYQEDIFGPEAFWWSPDGQEAVYMTTNLTGVGVANLIVIFGIKEHRCFRPQTQLTESLIKNLLLDMMGFD